MININFGLKKMLTFTQQSAKSAQNHFQMQFKEEKPGTNRNWPSSSSKQTSILSLTENEAAKKAEIMWALEVVTIKHYFCSCHNKSELFSSMFPDSQVAKTFACRKRKCKYLACYGIAPYFKEVLTKSPTELEHVCLLMSPTTIL